MNLVDNLLEVYDQTFADTQDKFAYRTKNIILPHETIAIPEFRDIYLDLSPIFPKS